MARLWQCGFELGSLSTGVEITTTSGTQAISTTTVRTGARALRVNTTTTTGMVRYHPFASDQAAVGIQRFYLNAASLPSATTYICRFLDGSNNSAGSIRLTSSGRLQLMTANNNQIGSDSAILSTGTWYMIELKTDATGSGTLEGRLDGSSFASGANNNQGTWSRITIGVITTNATADLFFDDWALNDGSGSTQNGWPGPGGILHLSPTGAGDSNGWSNTSNAAGSGNNYQLVDETPPNDTTDYVQTGAANTTDMYALTDSGIGASDTVNVVAVGLRLRNNTADPTTAVRAQVVKTSAGTVAQGSAIVPNSTAFATQAPVEPRNYSLVTYADPDGAAWTQATLDTAQAGVKLTTAGTNRIQVTALWLSVDYAPDTGGGTEVAVDPAIETDTAGTLGRAKTRAAAPAGETDAAQPISTAIVLPVDPAPETSTAQAVGRAKTLAKTTAVETGTAQAISRAKTLAVVPAAAAETAQALGRRKTAAIGPAVETDAAQAVETPAPVIPVGSASEMGTALGVGRSKSLALSPAGESDAAQAIAAGLVVALTPALETSTTQAVGARKARALVAAAELAAAQPIGRTKTAPVGPAVETATAQPATPAKTHAVGPAGETGTATTLGRAKTTTLAGASETEAAQPLGRAKRLTAAAAIEADTAQQPGHTFARPVPAVLETDYAVSLGSSGAVPIGPGGESDAARSLAHAKARAVGPVAELDTAVLLGRGKSRLLAAAVETGVALPVVRVIVQPVLPAAESDSALGIVALKRRTVFTVVELDMAMVIGASGGLVPAVPGVARLSSRSGPATQVVGSSGSLVAVASSSSAVVTMRGGAR